MHRGAPQLAGIIEAMLARKTSVPLAFWLFTVGCGPVIPLDEEGPSSSNTETSTSTDAPPTGTTTRATTTSGAASSSSSGPGDDSGASPSTGGSSGAPRPDPRGCLPPPVCGAGVLRGDATISTPEDIAAVGGYASITGSLIVTDSPFLCVSFLECLESIGGDLIVFDNDDLVDVSGLDHVAVVGASDDDDSGTIVFSENDALVELDTLDLLVQAPVSLLVHENQSLESISGFQDLAGTREDLEVRFNPNLTSIGPGGLLDILFIGGECVFSNNDLLSPALVDEVCVMGG